MKAPRYLCRAVAVTLAASGIALAGCRSALDVQNPQVIAEGQLQDPQLITVLMNSAVAAIDINYDEYVWYSAIITDEALNATNDYRSGELSQRIVELAQGDAGPYVTLARARALSDSIASRLQVLVPNAPNDLRLARALAYAGYSYLFYGEYLCTAPINQGPLLTDDSLWTLGLTRFNQAITIATAADAGSTKTVADSILNLARVGAARIEMDKGNKAAAITYAQAVDPKFVWWVQRITSAITSQENSLWSRVVGQNKQLGVHPLMQNLHDPRVRYATAAVLGHNQLTQLNVPYSPYTFSTFSTPDSTALQAFSNLNLSSGLEAQYIVAEASGPTAATIAFVNTRRAFGTEAPLAASADVMAALREEKRRDFFLGARRLGDLRRYKAQGIGDFFPSGPHPTKEWGLYGSATCYIIDQAEINSNPNVSNYNPGSTRPPGYSP